MQPDLDMWRELDRIFGDSGAEDHSQIIEEEPPSKTVKIIDTQIYPKTVMIDTTGRQPQTTMINTASKPLEQSPKRK